jgi:tRNA modification GTPase
VILGQVLGLVCDRGARIAEPGEFTLRAFLNKRIDLTQAQAIRDLINAQTGYQARLAMRQLQGSLSARLTPIKETLVNVIVQLESSVEFVEDDISPEARNTLIEKLDQAICSLEQAASSFNLGRHVREGFDLAIVGRPNVGKSSVFNRLIGRERAIVTELPGTTRDALYEATAVAGVPVRLVDTAGIRETTDVVENIGIVRSREAIADADVSLLLLDASEPLNNDDIILLNEVPEERRIIVYNKIDLLGKTKTGFLETGHPELLCISALTGEGFDALTSAILIQLSGETATERDDLIVTDARQHSALVSSIKLLRTARSLLSEGELEEVVLLRMKASLSSLGEITGETLTEDILGEIFSTFCIGK